MDSDLSWLYLLEDRFNREIGEKLIKPSDWHNEDINLVLPHKLLNKIGKINTYEYRKYKFLDSIMESKEVFSKYLYKKYSIKFQSDEISFAHNGTAALTLITRLLSKKGCKRVLLITPFYFSMRDNLKQQGMEIFYYHLSNKNDFKINTNELLKIVEEQFIDMIFITTPTYSVGTELELFKLKTITKFLSKTNKWIICDNTVGGMPWHGAPSIINKDLLTLAKAYTNFVYIESPTKKLFINGLKHSIIISSSKIAEETEPFADLTIGSLTIHQYEFINHLYSMKYEDEIKSALNKNIAIFKDNFNLCNAMTKNTNLFFPNTSSGFYTTLFFKEKKIKEVDHKKFVEYMLFERKLLLLPLNHFSFFKNTNFGVRVNLSKDSNKLAHFLNLIRDIDIHLFQHGN